MWNAVTARCTPSCPEVNDGYFANGVIRRNATTVDVRDVEIDFEAFETGDCGATPLFNLFAICDLVNRNDILKSGLVQISEDSVFEDSIELRVTDFKRTCHRIEGIFGSFLDRVGLRKVHQGLPKDLHRLTGIARVIFEI